MLRPTRERARREQTTLNEQFRRWLTDYTRQKERLESYDELMRELKGKVRVGRRPNRDELHER